MGGSNDSGQVLLVIGHAKPGQAKVCELQRPLRSVLHKQHISWFHILHTKTTQNDKRVKQPTGSR